MWWRVRRKAWTFFQSLANDDVKLNETQRIWTYLNHLLIFISRKETREKSSEFVVQLVKIREKDKIMENSHACFKSKLFLNFQRFLLRLAD